MFSLIKSTYLIRFCLSMLLVLAISFGIFQDNAYAYESTYSKLRDHQVGSKQNAGIKDITVTYGQQQYTQHFHCNEWAVDPGTPGRYTFSSLTGTFFNFIPSVSGKLQTSYHYTVDNQGGRWVEKSIPQKLTDELKAHMEGETERKLDAIKLINNS